MKDLGAYDPLGQSRSGLMYVSGAPDPVLLHGGVMDQATAIAASHAILTALLVRERSGIGQEVHVSLYGTGLWLMYPNIMLSSVMSLGPKDIHLTATTTLPCETFSAARMKNGSWLHIIPKRNTGLSSAKRLAKPPSLQILGLRIAQEEKFTLPSWSPFSTRFLQRRHKTNGWKSCSKKN